MDNFNVYSNCMFASRHFSFPPLKLLSCESMLMSYASARDVAGAHTPSGTVLLKFLGFFFFFFFLSKSYHYFVKILSGTIKRYVCVCVQNSPGLCQLHWRGAGRLPNSSGDEGEGRRTRGPDEDHQGRLEWKVRHVRSVLWYCLHCIVETLRR